MKTDKQLKPIEVVSESNTTDNAVVETAASVKPKKALTEEQRRKRLEYHKKYEAAHREQVKAWHKAYNQRKAKAKRKKREEEKWIQERTDAGRQAAEPTKSKEKK